MEQLRLWATEGRVNALTRVLADGFTDWKTLADFAETAALFDLPHPAATTVPPVMITSTGQKSRIAAGLLALFLGQFGVHWFYLGENTTGLIQLVIFLSGFPLIFVCGIGLPILIGVRIWAFVDAIRIFIGSIDRDGQGLPLRD
jgi:TM2 domain-containing membrane protein YozV